MDEANAAEGFNAPEEIDPEVLKLEEAVIALQDELAHVRRNVSWGYWRAGNAYAKPPMVKLQVTPLDVDKTEAPHA